MANYGSLTWKSQRQSTSFPPESISTGLSVGGSDHIHQGSAQVREILFILYIQLASSNVTIFLQSSKIALSAIYLWDKWENSFSIYASLRRLLLLSKQNSILIISKNPRHSSLLKRHRSLQNLNLLDSQRLNFEGHT